MTVKEERHKNPDRLSLERDIIKELYKGVGTGVTSFKGRTGAVIPAAGDYTAEQVGALSLNGGKLNGSLIINGSVAEGSDTQATSLTSHAEGCETIASANYSHAEGYGTVASAPRAHAEGWRCTASGWTSHAGGNSTIAHTLERAIGRYNRDSERADDNSYSPTGTSFLVIGNGDDENNKSNIFRVTASAIYGSAVFNSSGADYAEMFEWEDGNPNGEDRVGRFVTLNGSKIRLANHSDDFILGIVSATPSILGDNHSDQWKGMYERDIFGRIVRDKNDQLSTDEGDCVPDYVSRVNPSYNNTEKYIARSDRQEWAPVGLLGKLVMIDDGSCVENGWCKSSNNGIATRSLERTRYRVMERLDDFHVYILIL